MGALLVLMSIRRLFAYAVLRRKARNDPEVEGCQVRRFIGNLCDILMWQHGRTIWRHP